MHPYFHACLKSQQEGRLSSPWVIGVVCCFWSSVIREWQTCLTCHQPAQVRGNVLSAGQICTAFQSKQQVSTRCVRMHKQMQIT